jgi:hypothetical protein
MSKKSKAPAEFVQLADTEHFTSFGFWKPGMERVHAKVRGVLREMGLRFWGDSERELRVHPDDFAQANAVLLCTERNELPHEALGH